MTIIIHTPLTTIAFHTPLPSPQLQPERVEYENEEAELYARLTQNAEPKLEQNWT